MTDDKILIFKKCWEHRVGFHGASAILRDDFLQWLWDQDLQPVLYHRIRSRFPIDGFLEFLRPEHARQSLIEMRRLEEFQATVSEFERREIPLIVLKGAALAYLAYPEPHLRPRCDTDLLIRREDLPQVKEIITHRGYAWENMLEGDLVSYQQMASKVDPFGIQHVVDIHWKLSNPQLFSDLFAWQELWDSSTPLAKLHPNARALSPVYQLLHACVHQISHHAGDERVIWMLDIYLLAETFSQNQWRDAVSKAEEKKILQVFSKCLKQARSLFEFTVPAFINEKLEGTGRLSEPTAAFLRPGFSVKNIWASDFRQLPPKQRLRLLREHLFPSPDYMKRKYPSSRFLWLPWLYLRRISGGIRKWLFR